MERDDEYVREGEDEHEGTFARGQEHVEHHPEREQHGDFAEGQENWLEGRRRDDDD